MKGETGSPLDQLPLQNPRPALCFQSQSAVFGEVRDTLRGRGPELRPFAFRFASLTTSAGRERFGHLK